MHKRNLISYQQTIFSGKRLMQNRRFYIDTDNITFAFIQHLRNTAHFSECKNIYGIGGFDGGFYMCLGQGDRRSGKWDYKSKTTR